MPPHTSLQTLNISHYLLSFLDNNGPLDSILPILLHPGGSLSQRTRFTPLLHTPPSHRGKPPPTDAVAVAAALEPSPPPHPLHSAPPVPSSGAANRRQPPHPSPLQSAHTFNPSHLQSALVQPDGRSVLGSAPLTRAVLGGAATATAAR